MYFYMNYDEEFVIVLSDDVTTDSAPKLWREAFATELLATVHV